MQFVSISAFPKSGVTFLSSLLFYSLYEDDDPTTIEQNYIIDIHLHDLSKAKPCYDRVFYKNHYAYNVAKRYCTLASKVIYLIRDPVDIMRSAYDFLALTGEKSRLPTLDQFARDWIATQASHFEVAGSWPGHVSSWLDQVDRPIHLVRYRDLVDHPAEQLASIFTFLNLDPPAASIERGLRNSTMAAMRAREEAEFQAKLPGVFYSEAVARGMAGGARFINKGYRHSYDDLGENEKRLADEQFGALRARYLA